MLNYLQAQEILGLHARSFGKETIGLEHAYGRVLAGTILADRDYPPFDRSTVDGYAIRHEDFEQGIRHFRIAEKLYAGWQTATMIQSGQCYQIMTGAALPPGADAVVKREDTDEPAPSRGDGHGTAAISEINMLTTVLSPFSAYCAERERTCEAAIRPSRPPVSAGRLQ